MEVKLEMELYTRPTCSDCQDAKKYLTSNGIRYTDKDVSENPGLEEDLKRISGARIVPKEEYSVEESLLNILLDLQTIKTK